MDAALMPGIPVIAGTGVPTGTEADAARTGSTVVQFLAALTAALAPPPSPAMPTAASAPVPKGQVPATISGDGAAAERASSPDEALAALVRRLLAPQASADERGAAGDRYGDGALAATLAGATDEMAFVDGEATRVEPSVAAPYAGRSLRDAAMRALPPMHEHVPLPGAGDDVTDQTGEEVDPTERPEVLGTASEASASEASASVHGTMHRADGRRQAAHAWDRPIGDDLLGDGAAMANVAPAAATNASTRRALRATAPGATTTDDPATTDRTDPAAITSSMASTAMTAANTSSRTADLAERGSAPHPAATVVAAVAASTAIASTASATQSDLQRSAANDDAAILSVAPAASAAAADRPAKGAKRPSTDDLVGDSAVSSTSGRATSTDVRPDAVTGSASTYPGRAAATAALPANGLGMAGTERIERLRQHAAYRPLQRLTVELDDARVAVRVRDGKVSVDVMSDPSSSLGTGWARGAERTIERAMDAAGQLRGSGTGTDTAGERSAAGFGTQRREPIGDLRAADPSATHDQSGGRDAGGGHPGDRGRHGAGNQADGRPGRRGDRPAREWFPIEEDA